MNKQLAFLTVLATVLSPLGTLLESRLSLHILVEFPLLFIGGAALSHSLSSSITLGNWNRGGICGLLATSLLLAFWMIPRWLDESLTYPPVAMAKYLSLLSAGSLLAMSWPRANSITRALIKIEFLTMLYRLGWLYLISPQRLCNNYLLVDQVQFGQYLLAIGSLLSLIWVYPVFFGVSARPTSGLSDNSNAF